MMRNAVLAVAASALTLTGCGGYVDPDGSASSDVAAGLGGSSPSTSSTGSPSTEPTGSGGSAEDSNSSGAACSQQQTAPHPELQGQLPAGFPTVAGWQPTQVTDQGRTRVVSGVLRGEAGDLVTVRDNAADELVGSGYRQTGTDEEVGFEAEAEFEGPQEVGIKVRPLCRDYLVLSYTVAR